MARVEIDQDIGTVAARIAGDSPAMDVAAGTVLARAVALAQKHRKTGAYIAAFGIERIPGENGVTDRGVYNDDPQVAAIEFGHLGRGGRYVAGQYILTEAAAGPA